MSIVKNIIQEYLDLENKTINTVEILAQRYGLTTRELISLLKQYNIETPKLFSRIEAMDWSNIERIKKEYIKEQVSKEMELDNDMSVDVSIQKYFNDLGFDKKKGSEKAKVLCHYVKTQFGIDAFDVLVSVLVNLIKGRGKFTIEKVLGAIKNRDSETTIDNKRDSIINQIQAKMLGMTKNIMFKADNEKKERIKEGFGIINDSFDKEHKRKMKKGFKIIESVLGKQVVRLEPNPKVVDKPKPKRKKKFTGDEVIKLLESV